MHDPVSCTSLAFLSPITILPVKSIFPSFNPRTYDPSSSSIPQPFAAAFPTAFTGAFTGAFIKVRVLAGKFEWDEYFFFYMGMVKSWKLFTVETCNLRGR